MSRWLKILLSVLVVAGIGLLSIPWWLGFALRPVLRARGVTFERYERTGYAHFQLTGVRYGNAQVELTARRIQSLTPLAWFGQRLRGREPSIMVAGGRIQRMPAATRGTGIPASPKAEAAQTPVSSLPDLLAVLRRITPHLGYWLPRAHLSAAEIRGFGPDIAIDQAHWLGSTLSIDGVRAGDQVLALAFAPAADGTMVLTAHTAGNEATLRLVWSGADVQGEAALWNQPLQLTARFPAQGWMPAEASAVAEKWSLPAARVRLGAPYAQVLGGGRLLWREGVFDLSVNVRAEPAADDKKKTPPVEATATAHGNLRELTVTALHIDAPFATAKLTAPVTFSLDHPLPAEAAQLAVQADLAKLPWLESRGRAEGTVTVTGSSAAARQDFEFEFTDVAAHGFTLKKARARGYLQWPKLELTELKVALDETNSIEAHGAINWQTRELTGAALSAKLDSDRFARWLPAGAKWAAAEITATAEGPLDAPRSKGSLKITELQWKPLQPLAIAATWQGEGAKTDISATATAGSSSLEFAGTLEPAAVSLTKFQLNAPPSPALVAGDSPRNLPGSADPRPVARRPNLTEELPRQPAAKDLPSAAAGQAVWQLAAPARMTWAPAWQVETLQLTGPTSALTFKGGADGAFELTVTEFDSGWLRDWVTVTGPAWQMHQLHTTGHIAEGVLVFESELAAQIEMSPRPAQVKLVASGDAHGVQVKDLKVVDGDRVLTQATGRMPLAWMTQPKPHLSLDDSAPLELAITTEPDSPLWATLGAYTGLELIKPEAKINVKGTLRQPAGELQLKFAQLSATGDRFKFSLPEFEDVTLVMQFDREAATLTSLAGKVEGQAVQASGRVPMDNSGWQQLWREPTAFDWRKVEAHLEIPAADLAPISRRFPAFVAAQGKLHARVELKPGGKFSGELQLTDAASRPLPPFGTLQEVKADLVLNDGTITVRTMTAKLGGEPVALDGSVSFAPAGPPKLALGLKGKNLPLVRNTGLLLRVDLDLHANTDAGGVTRLGGAVEVRDCLMLASLSLRALLPTGVRGVTRQPPYFAVETEPYRHWPLAVDVRAPKTVRLRTTVFNGTASARFQLGGTLGEPRAVGDVTMDQGQVLFPFATFKVQSGSVQLREADPFHAVVNLSASSQRRDYQLRLEATGELPTPNILLSSTPSLEAGEVLLMVMTGQPPAGGTGASTGQRLALLGAYLSRGLFQDLGIGGEERLEVSAGEQVSLEGRDTYEFEYKLGKRWSALGEYDRFDAYNAGIRFHLYTQESVPREKK